MIVAVKGLARIRPHHSDDTRYLFQVLIGACSVVEANIALDLLSKSVPDRTLVAAINLREAVKAIPPTPFRMAVDEETMVRAGRLTRDLATFRRTTPDGYDVVVTTAGNLVLDLIIKVRDEKHFWTPVPSTQDLVDPELVAHIIESEHLFETVIEVVTAMGMVFNPTLFLSIEDWHLEHARDAIEGLDGLF